MKKLPFDLAKALAGAKLVTRDGKNAGKFRARPASDDLVGAIEDWPYCADIEGVKGSITFTQHGKASFGNRQTQHDLFLLDESDQPAPEVAPAKRTNPNDTVFPVESVKDSVSQMMPDGHIEITKFTSGGLTKREYFAACALQGLLAEGDSSGNPSTVASEAVRFADALMAELNKEPNK